MQLSPSRANIYARSNATWLSRNGEDAARRGRQHRSAHARKNRERNTAKKKQEMVTNFPGQQLTREITK